MATHPPNQDSEVQRDNKKTAVSIWVTLSSQVIGATLAIIAVQGAIATFILDKRSPSKGFFIVSGIAFIIFIISILNGGVAISRITKSGFGGTWDLDIGRANIQRQTILCLLGIVIFFLSFFLSGSTKDDSQQQEIKQIKENVEVQQKLETRVNSLEKTINELKAEIEKNKPKQP